MNNQGKLLIGGIVAVLIAFSLSFIFENLWIGYWTAFAVATVWLFILDRSIISKSSSRVLIRTFIVLFLITQLLAAIQFYNQSVRQVEILRTIRTTIVSNISQTEMEKALQHTLRHYYMDSDPSETTLENSFRELFGDRMEEGGRFLHEHDSPDEDMNFTYKIATPDSIVLAVTATYTPGIDPNFENNTGKRGMYQAHTILTKNGVRYEREN
ncbi:hypothetical protein [Rhodohalobacter sp.]|uniref:hypothetical protein n=1 Tax=Rhodohalobacter sp. TaxID=1974210 RepID=UPI002ACEF9E1|nr:hypothetical protein [Rhodohalobacter sp.]MDZ7756732.1 hypothetical protein [Rhodohalobacter sp.]